MKSLYAMIIAAVMALPMSIAHAATKDIVDTAAGAGKFETLIAAAKAAGLVETLKGPGPFTVFAPTDEAFAKLPKGTVEDLLKPENKAKLAAILTYHVLPGKVMAADIAGKKANVKTVQGSESGRRRHHGRQGQRCDRHHRGCRRLEWRDPHHRHCRYAEAVSDPCRLTSKVVPLLTR